MATAVTNTNSHMVGGDPEVHSTGSSVYARPQQGILDWAACSYFILWVYEGVLRKWLLPGLDSGIYFARDLLIWGVFAWLFITRASGKKDLVGPGWILGFSFGLFSLLQILVLQVGPASGLIGLLQYLTPAAAAIGIVGRVSRDGKRRLVKALAVSVWIQLAIAILQVVSPQNSYINRVGVDEFQNLVTVGEQVRASGTFTAPIGLVSFLSLAAAIAAAGLACRKLPLVENASLWFRPIPLISAVAIASAISGSRSAIFNLVFILVAGMFLRRTASIPGYFVFKMGGLAAAVLIASVIFFPQVIQGFQQRFENANQSESSSGRVLYQATGYLLAAPENIWIGDGLGSHSQAGIKVSGTGTWIENETIRWPTELGILGLVLCLLRQILVVPLAWKLWSDTKVPEDTLAVMSLVALAPILIAGQMNAQPSAAGFCVIAGGFILATLRRPYA